jgi:hypothetical protein
MKNKRLLELAGLSAMFDDITSGVGKVINYNTATNKYSIKLKGKTIEVSSLRFKLNPGDKVKLEYIIGPGWRIVEKIK